MVLSVSIYGQTDKYGNYFNSKHAVPPIKGDGNTNDRAAIQTALQKYKSVFFPYTENGYRIEGTLSVPAGCSLILERGAKFVGTGTIMGNGAYINAGLYQCFGSGVTITGTWVARLS